MSDLLKDHFLQEHVNPLTLSLLNYVWENSDQKNITEYVLRRLFQTAYLKHLAQVKGELFLLSTIHTDGVGDYYALLKSAKLFQKTYPDLNVVVVYTHKQKLPSINPADYLLREDQIEPFLELSKPVLEPVLEGTLVPSFEEKLMKLQEEKSDYEKILLVNDSIAIRELVHELDRDIVSLENEKRAFQLYERMKNSVAIINIALAFNTFENPALASKSFYFAEAGNFQGIPAFLKLNWFSMGVQAFDEGIFLKSTEIPTSWKDPALPTFLWGSLKPKNTLFLGYLPRLDHELEVFIKLICLREQKNSQQIDVVLPFAECDINLNREWLKERGIHRLERVNWSPEEIKHSLQEHEMGGKTLRLIFTSPLHEHDFILMMHAANELVGCTGDGSISECLTLKKIPFYATRKHKVKAIEAFQELAIFLKLELIANYFSSIAHMRESATEEAAEAFFELLENPLFKTEWNTYLTFVERYYCLEDAMIAHLNRHFQSDAVKKEEELLVQKVLSGSLSAKEAYSKISEIL